MEKTLTVAKCLYDMYQDMFHEAMDQMKMHKLMYLVQRESLMYRKKVLFEEDFFGWKYGPVLKSVRSEYVTGAMFSGVTENVSRSTMELLESVLARYGAYSSWKLSNLSHGEFSWKAARKGLKAEENGDVKLTVNSMMLDAMRELASRKAQG